MHTFWTTGIFYKDKPFTSKIIQRGCCLCVVDVTAVNATAVNVTAVDVTAVDVISSDASSDVTSSDDLINIIFSQIRLSSTIWLFNFLFSVSGKCFNLIRNGGKYKDDCPSKTGIDLNFGVMRFCNFVAGGQAQPSPSLFRRKEGGS